MPYLQSHHNDPDASVPDPLFVGIMTAGVVTRGGPVARRCSFCWEVTLSDARLLAVGSSIGTGEMRGGSGGDMVRLELRLIR